MTVAGGTTTPLGLTLHVPTRVRFGRGVRSEAGPAAAELGRTVVLVHGASLARNPAGSPIPSEMRAAGLEVHELAVGTGEPDDEAVIRLAAHLGAVGAEVVVAIGGGSVLDLAKASALLPDVPTLAGWLRGERVSARRGIPVVALPTTAGTGAEVSHGAIILDRAARRKRGVRGIGVAPAVALIDPELTVSTDADLTAAAGFDAVAHAIETAASRAASDLVVHLSGIALPLLLEALPRAMAEPRDHDSREQAAYAAFLMGINLATSTTCLPHRLQYPVGAATGTRHADGVAALMPAWLHRVHRLAPEHLARLAVAAGIAPPGATSDAAAGHLVGVIEGHLDATGMRRTLAELGIRRADLPHLVDAVEGSVANDPGPVQASDLLGLYEESL